MSKETKESVELVIAGRSYPVLATKTTRPKLEAIAESINQKLLDIQLQYVDRDRQDCLAMSLLSSAVELEETRSRLEELSAKISDTIS